jgi:hypothetical protein
MTWSYSLYVRAKQFVAWQLNRAWDYGLCVSTVALRHSGKGSSGVVFLLFGWRVPTARRNPPQRSTAVKHFKDIRACIASLQALQGRSDITPAQKKYVGAAVEEAKRLRRTHGVSEAKIFRSFRRITESLINAFFKW